MNQNQIRALRLKTWVIARELLVLVVLVVLIAAHVVAFLLALPLVTCSALIAQCVSGRRSRPAESTSPPDRS